MRYNTVFLVGNITQDPTFHTIKNGDTVCNFDIAVYRSRNATDFFRVSCWNHLSNFVHQNLRKGNKVQVIGSIHRDKGKDGKYYTYVTADDVARSEYNRDPEPNDVVDEPSGQEEYTTVDTESESYEEIPF